MGKMGKVYVVIATLIIGVLATYIVCDKVLMKRDDSKQTPSSYRVRL